MKINQIDSTVIRKFLLWMEYTGHNKGGVLTSYRALKAFLHWYEEETDTITAIHKVKAPRKPFEPLEGVSLDTVMQLVNVCKNNTFMDARDKAILLGLLDTGTRAREFLSIDLPDTNLETGSALIRKSKSGKPRTVYFGNKSRGAISLYLNHCHDTNPALWVTHYGERLSYNGLRVIIGKRSEQAGLDKQPSLHSFRRGHAISMLRAGTDVYTLARLMGHSDINILKHYLHLTNTDTAEAHRKFGPIDGSNYG